MGLGEEGEQWELQRIGTETEKQSVEKELAELRDRLQQVEDWKRRRGEIDDELNQVWVRDEETGQDEVLPPPPYQEEAA